MTTYTYTITLNDSESIALEFGMDVLIRHCDEMIAEGAWAPYFAHKGSYQQIAKKLRYAETEMTSTSSFCQ